MPQALKLCLAAADMAYPLSKSSKEFRFRNVFMWLMIGAMLFSGGLIPLYMVVNSLHLYSP